MLSMTGYGETSAADERHQVAASVRSVNGRYLDVTVRLKEEYRRLEPALRRLVEERLERGRVDLTVDIKPLAAPRLRVAVATEAVEALHSACRELADRGLVTSGLQAGDVLRLPGVVTLESVADPLDDADLPLVEDVVRRSVDQLLEARRAEGAQLAELIAGRVDELRSTIDALGDRVGVVREGLQQSLRERLGAILEGTTVDEDRIVQEAAILADKGDVAEELDRLGAHVDHFRQVMAAEEPVGRRLDFLTQEILRELNTVGSKGRDAELTRLVLDAKVLCEQLREQLQNVE